MTTASFPPWPSFSEEEAEAVATVLRSNKVNYWTGDRCKLFEAEFAAWTGSPHAIAVANGTLALDLALKALNIGAGDEAIVSPRSFIASVSCVVNAGARPVFADVDPDSGNISPETIAPLITERTRAILPVHLAGWPCDMPAIMALARTHGIAVIEDCAQAHGAAIGGRSVGTFGDVGAWSFCQDKIITTGGEGGMVTTASEELWTAMWQYKDHGKDWAAVHASHPPGYRWLHGSFGTNFRLTEMQAAIGRIQLKRLSQWTERRNLIAQRYRDMLSEFSDMVRVPSPREEARHAYYRLYAYIRPEGLRAGWSRDRVVAEIVEAGGVIQHGSCPELYLEPAFRGTGFAPRSRLPIARQLGETSLMFLTHPTIDDTTLDRLCGTAAMVLRRAARSSQ